MTSSAKNLADRLNALVSENLAAVIETPMRAIVSRLNAAAAQDLAQLCRSTQLLYRIFDTENEAYADENVRTECEPFRIEVEKKEPQEGKLWVLTASGLSQLLFQDLPQKHWHVASLESPIVTLGLTLDSWEGSAATAHSSTKSPRVVVRDSTASRAVPADGGRWILSEPTANLRDDVASQTWASIAAHKLLYCLPDEVTEDGGLKFKGPPKLALRIDNGESALQDLGAEGFADLQIAAQWVYENPRETDMKHGLLSLEISRSGGTTSSATEYLKKNLRDALACAKTAYQMALSELGRETVKALGELRKSVTDEVAKVNDTTRQVIAAVATAVAAGIGLTAAKFTTALSPGVIAAILIAVLSYVVMTIGAGWHFIFIQRRLRREWQPRLYRFLSVSEYRDMVGNPTAQSEQAFFFASAMAILVCIALFVSGVYAFTSG